jgi:hypothetical protein
MGRFSAPGASFLLINNSASLALKIQMLSVFRHSQFLHRPGIHQAAVCKDVPNEHFRIVFQKITGDKQLPVAISGIFLTA